VGAGQYAHLAHDGPDLVQTPTVGTLAPLQDHPAHGVLLDPAEDLAHVTALAGVVRVLLDELGQDVLLDRGQRLVALLLVLEGHGFGHLGRGHSLDLLGQRLVGKDRRPGHLHRMDVLEELLLELHQLADAFVGDPQSFKDLGLRDLDRATLHHHDGVLRPGDNDVDVGVLELLEGRIQNPVPPDPTHPDRSHEGVERDLRHVERRRRAEESQDVGIVLLIGADDPGHDLGLVHEALGEQGPQGTVGETRREDLLLGGAGLTLDEPAGELPGGVRLLPVFHGQGEEWEVRGPVLCGHGHEDGGLSKLDQARPVGLPGHPAGLEGEVPSGKLSFNPLHLLCFSFGRPAAGRGCPGSVGSVGRPYGAAESTREG
jgi:hypothetical protein